MDLNLEEIVTFPKEKANVKVGDFVLRTKEEDFNVDEDESEFIRFLPVEFYEGKAYEILDLNFYKHRSFFDCEDCLVDVSLDNFKRIVDSKNFIDKKSIREHFRKTDFREIFLSDNKAVYSFEDYNVEVNPVQIIYEKLLPEHKIAFSYSCLPQNLDEVKNILQLSKSLYTKINW